MGKLKRIAALSLAMMMLLSGCSQYIEEGFYADETTESADNQEDMSAEGTSGTEFETESEAKTETDNGDFLDLDSGVGQPETESAVTESEQPSDTSSAEETETESEEYLDLWSEQEVNETETEEDDDDGRDITFSKSENFMLTLYEGGSVTIQVNDDEPYTVWCEDDKRYYEDSEGIVELTDPLTYGMYFDTGCSIGDRVSMSIKPSEGFLVGSCFDYYSLKNFDNFEVNSEGFDYTVKLEKKTWAFITYNKWRDVIRRGISTYAVAEGSDSVANCTVSPTSTSSDANGTSVFNMLFNGVDLRIGVCASPKRKTTDTNGTAVTTTAWNGDGSDNWYNIALAAMLTCPIDLNKYRGGAQKGDEIGTNPMNGGNNGIGVYWMTGDAEGVWNGVSCRAGNGNYFGELHGFLGYLNNKYFDATHADGAGWDDFISEGECTTLIASLKSWIGTHTDLMEASAFNMCATYYIGNTPCQRIC